MAIQLFKHNQDAYTATVQMLKTTGKAAVIHPTGTGKSFIAFKLCEDHPEKTICWLSPSIYIFKTQLENLQKAGGDDLENIRFFTYARLINMTPSEIAAIEPDYIILDEFPRCGAEVWGQGVQTLLTAFLDTPVLGLSATAIRYLDNQRDMSDELFDGNIASEMTLGEAIVRGILNPPKYVLSVFSYQIDLENRSGKYIVFCANFDHMQDMIAMASQWFSGVDNTPHIYCAYSDDPETDKAFAAFKADSSDHLKLLYCIDMLNEGIHVDDVKLVVSAELYGFPGRMDRIKQICEKHGALLIEDAAEAMGATIDGRQCGSFGDYSAISYNGNKIITGSAGGCLLTNNIEMANKSRKWSTQSRENAPWYQHEEVGYNYRMSNVVAGVVRGQYPHLEEHMCKQVRDDSEALYSKEPGKSCPTEILEALAKYTAEGRPIWKPMHMQPMYRMHEFITREGSGRCKTNAYIAGGCVDVGADIFHRGLCLPSDNKMTAEEQAVIIVAVRNCFA